MCNHTLESDTGGWQFIPIHAALEFQYQNTVWSKLDFAAFKKVEVHAENSTF